MPLETYSQSENVMSGFFNTKESLVQAIWDDSYYRNNDTPEQPVEVARLTGTISRFHPTRLERHADEINALLCDLPATSRQSNGTGLLLSHTLRRRGGVQWTDDEDVLIKLLELGVAIGKLIFLLPLGKDRVDAYSMDTVMILVLDEK